MSEAFSKALPLATNSLFSESDLQVPTEFPLRDYASNYWPRDLNR
jgi:hypothetical protein